MGSTTVNELVNIRILCRSNFNIFYCYCKDDPSCVLFLLYCQSILSDWNFLTFSRDSSFTWASQHSLTAFLILWYVYHQLFNISLKSNNFLKRRNSWHFSIISRETCILMVHCAIFKRGVCLTLVCIELYCTVSVLVIWNMITLD